jgi:Fic family protein
LRDEANRIAPAVDREKEAALLSKMIGAMMGTQSVRLYSPIAIARGRGEGYDPERLDLFEALRVHLASSHFANRPARDTAHYLPFFEAYFSNFIEGTEFVVDEAYRLVYEGVIPAGRPEDAHDVMGTFKIVADNFERSRVAASSSDFIDLLRTRHAFLLGGRPGEHPGEFKTAANKVGSTVFVDPALVLGTLRKGFEVLATLQAPLARAVFVMFLISEVHPFKDVNGRLARIAMNSELSAADQERIIIPTVFRTEYLQSLRALSHNKVAEGLARVLDFAQRYVSEISFEAYESARAQLERTNAFKEPADAMGASDRLVLPSRLLGAESLVL